MNANTKTQTTTRHCLCGCGGSTSSSKTQYRPGHDARHAGSVARDYAAYLLANGAEGVDHSHSMLDELGSNRLRLKAVNMATKIIAKATGQLKKPADRKPKVQDPALTEADGEDAALYLTVQDEAPVLSKVKGEPVQAMWDEDIDEDGNYHGPWKIEDVKVGRWTYPARRHHDGQIVRNTKRDGSGTWVEFVPATTK